MKYRMVLLLFVSVVCFAWTSQAQAQRYGYGYRAPFYGYGMGYAYNALSYRVPYFAAHPPVYYDRITPRSMGQSPFAYPPTFRDDVFPEAPIIKNPYVPEKPKAEKAEEMSQRVTAAQPQPVVIANPYFQPQQAVADSGPAR